VVLVMGAGAWGAGGESAWGKMGWAELVGFGLVFLALPAAAVLWVKDIVRPGSFRRVRDVTAWPWWFWGLCALVVLFAQGAGAGLGSAVMGVRAAGKAMSWAEQAIAGPAGGMAGVVG